VAHSEGIGALAQVVEEGAMVRRMETAVGVEDERALRGKWEMWKVRGVEGWALVGRRRRRRGVRWWRRWMCMAVDDNGDGWTWCCGEKWLVGW
jgi:hypothetical protein